VDQVSEIADRVDDDDDEDVTDYTTDYTISESLEEKDHEALALERSSGLVHSTGETFEYVESDGSSGTVTPLNEELGMTLRMKDIGSPVAHSTLVNDDHSTDESKDAVENVLPRNGNEEVHSEDQKHHDDSCSADVLAGSESEKPQLRRDVSTDDSKGTEDHLRSQHDNKEFTTDQLHQRITCTTVDKVVLDLVPHEFKIDDSKDAEDHLLSQRDNIELTANEQHQRITCTTDVRVVLDLVPQEFNRDYSRGDSKGAEDILSPVNDDLNMTAEDQQYHEDSSASHSDEGLEVKREEPEQDNIDGGNSLGRTFTLKDASEASVSSLQGHRADDVTNEEQDSSSPENSGDKDHDDNEQDIHPGTYLANGGMQDEKHNSQGVCSPLSTISDQFVPEPEQIQTEGGSLLGRTITLSSGSEDGIIPSTSDHTPRTLDRLDNEERSSCGERFNENEKQDGRQNDLRDDNNLAVKPDQKVSIADPNNHQVNASCDKDVDEDESQKKSLDFQENREHETSSTDLLPIAALVDQPKAICFPEDRKEDKMPVNSDTGPDLSVATLTPDCLQLELLSKSVVKAGDLPLPLDVIQRPAASNTWSEDEDKSNLLCLLDSRRRTEMDNNNWQVARHIQDEMTLVKDAELDDLENVQVSVKVSWIYS